jgi:N-methylhydantoinase A
MSHLINIDIGGTHTDGILIDEDGNMVSGKVPSTPKNFSEGFFDSIELIADKRDVSVRDLLGSATLVSHGTTVGTNAIIEEEHADTVLLTTKANESVLTLMRGAKGRADGLLAEEYLNTQEVSKPDPLIPRDRVFGVDERMDYAGEVVVDLDADGARAIAEKIGDLDVDAAAVSFLWSFLNDDHEQEMVSILNDKIDDLFVSVSSELAPIWGEYERTTATTINAMIGPTISDYISKINHELTERGYDGTLLVMQVGGGLMPAEEAVEKPVHTIDSGPAAGISGCAYLADKLGHDNVIAADMGGTSFDVGLITDGEPFTESTNVIKQYSYGIRNIDVESIGSGGGSIAWVDESVERLHVGPNSAGANPGPACYDRGGTNATVTDADVLCNILDPDNFLSGRLSLNVDRARNEVDAIAETLDMSVMEAARGIIQISNSRMADHIRRLTINSGYDPRDFRVYAYGGAGPTHLPMIASQIGINEVIVPMGESSGVWSAVGIASTDVLHRQEMSNIRSFAPFDPEKLTSQFEELEREIRDQLDTEGFDEDEKEIERFANIKYGLQVHEQSIPVPNGDLTEDDMDDMLERFEREYEKRHGEGSGASETGFALSTIRCDGYGKTTEPRLARSDDHVSGTGAPSRTQEVFWPGEGRRVESAVYYGDDVETHMEIDGPGVIRLSNTTISVPPGQEASIDGYGNVIVRGGGDA